MLKLVKRSQILKINRLNFPIACATTNPTVIQAQKKFWEKNQKLQRPLSPHLTIYKLPLSAKLSISFRATGAALTGATYAFGLGSLYWSGQFDQVLDVIQHNVPPQILFAAKLLIAFPVCFHTLNGVRHLIWDYGKGLDLPTLTKSGYALIVASLLSGVALAMI